MEGQLREGRDKIYEASTSTLNINMLRRGSTLCLGQTAFKILNKLGKGGFGVVFNVCDTNDPDGFQHVFPITCSNVLWC